MSHVYLTQANSMECIAGIETRELNMIAPHCPVLSSVYGVVLGTVSVSLINIQSIILYNQI